MFLSRQDLIELVGTERPSAAARWLQQNGIPYVTGIDKWPRVLTSVIEAKMGGSLSTLAKEPRLRLG